MKEAKWSAGVKFAGAKDKKKKALDPVADYRM